MEEKEYSELIREAEKILQRARLKPIQERLAEEIGNTLKRSGLEYFHTQRSSESFRNLIGGWRIFLEKKAGISKEESSTAGMVAALVTIYERIKEKQ